MAVVVTPKAVKLQIKYFGELVNGKQTYVSKTYAKLNAAAVDQDIFDVAQGIASLQEKALHSVNKALDSEITEA